MPKIKEQTLIPLVGLRITKNNNDLKKLKVKENINLQK